MRLRLGPGVGVAEQVAADIVVAVVVARKMPDRTRITSARQKFKTRGVVVR
jgi:hypothetical protein